MFLDRNFYLEELIRCPSSPLKLVPDYVVIKSLGNILGSLASRAKLSLQALADGVPEEDVQESVPGGRDCVQLARLAQYIENMKEGGGEERSEGEELLWEARGLLYATVRQG